jgi:hypothetical protein
LVRPELISYRQQFEQIVEEAKAIVAGLTEEEFNWRPAAGEWSVEECMAHLTMTGNVILGHVEGAIDRALERRLYSTTKFELSMIERFVLRETEPPVRHTVSAPKRFVPAHNQPATGVMPSFYHVQRMFILQIERADGLDLRRIKVQTPISRFLRLSLGATFPQAAAHARRHLAQARRVRSKIPKGVPLPATH